MQFYLIRHLPTSWNEKGLLQGSKDIPINKERIHLFENQINENKRIIQESEPFDIVLSSSLVRTQKTAELYGMNDVVIDSNLDELNFGSYEGRSKEFLINSIEDNWFEDPISINSLGEKMEHFQARIMQFIEEYSSYKKLLIFGHGSWIRAFHSIVMSGDINEMNKITLTNNELMQITIPDRLKEQIKKQFRREQR